MSKKQQIWVDLETKRKLKEMADCEKKTLMDLLKGFANKKSKKSQIPPFLFLIFLIVGLVILAVAIPIFLKVSDDINTDMQTDDSLTVESKATYGGVNAGMSGWFDNGWLALFIGTWLAVMIGSFFYSEHPIFFVISLIIMFIFMFVSANLSNLYTETSEDPDFITYSAGLTNINFVMNHLVEFIIAIFISMGLAGTLRYISR